MHIRRQLGRGLEWFQPKPMKKLKLSVKNFYKTGFLAKNGHFLTDFGQKIPNYEFFHGYHYSHTLEDT